RARPPDQGEGPPQASPEASPRGAADAHRLRKRRLPGAFFVEGRGWSNCLGSSNSSYRLRVPGTLITNHCVEHHKQLPHACGKGDFLGFAAGEQSLVKTLDEGIPLCGNERAHIERSAHGGASSPDGSPSSERAAVAAEGGHADQCGNLLG